MGGRDRSYVRTLTGQPVWSRLPSGTDTRKRVNQPSGSQEVTLACPVSFTCTLWHTHRFKLNAIKPEASSVVLATFEVLSP